MKKYYGYLGLAIIMAASFYYTEQIANIVLLKNPLMVEINEQKDNYEVEFVNASINGEYIIPGINGLQVNARDTYYNMQKLDVFNKYYLVYEQVKPDISLEDNKDKIINKGNRKLNQVSIILEGTGEISEYFKENKIKASILATIDTYQAKDYFEAINNEINGFKSLENNLNLNKENKNICVVNDNNLEICKKNKKYLVEPTVVLNQNNLIEVKKNVQKGLIVLIKGNVSLTDVKILLKEINYKGLEIVYLSELISEENNNY